MELRADDGAGMSNHDAAHSHGNDSRAVRAVGIEAPDRDVEHGREGHPGEIRHHQQRRPAVDGAEGERGHHHGRLPARRWSPAPRRSCAGRRTPRVQPSLSASCSANSVSGPRLVSRSARATRATRQRPSARRAPSRPGRTPRRADVKDGLARSAYQVSTLIAIDRRRRARRCRGRAPRTGRQRDQVDQAVARHGSGQQARADIDRQREDGGVEGEGHDAVHHA